MRIYGFQGIRFQGSPEVAGGVAAPPYDQIDDVLRDELHQVEHQFAHISRPKGETVEEGHSRAAETHAAWLSEGVLAEDDEPSVYPYDIVLPDGSIRLGLSALVGVEAEDSPIIRRHEFTISKHVAERLALLDRTQVDLEPILLLSEDGGTLDAQISIDIAEQSPIATHRDEYGNLHRLYQLSGLEAVTTYKGLLAECSGLIADGHHRYKVSRLYADQCGAEPGDARAAKLAVITSLNSPTLAIDPIHRGLKGDYPLDGIVPVQRSAWPGSNDSSNGDANSASFVQAVADAPAPALGVWTRDGAEIWQLDVSGPSRYPDSAADLAVLALHERVLPRLGLTDEDATNGTVRYRSDPDKLMAEVRDGDLDIGLFLPPMSPSLFAAAVSKGDVLPPKSTRFLPKVVSGLVWSAHDGALL